MGGREARDGRGQSWSAVGELRLAWWSGIAGRGPAMQLAGVQGPLSVLHLTLATTGRAELGAPCKVAGPCPSSTSTDKVSIAPDGEESGSIIEAVKGGMEHTGSSLVTVLLAVHRAPFPFSQCHSCRGPLPGPEPSFSMGLSPGRAAWGLLWELSVHLHYRHRKPRTQTRGRPRHPPCACL